MVVVLKFPALDNIGTLGITCTPANNKKHQDIILLFWICININNSRFLKLQRREAI